LASGTDSMRTIRRSAAARVKQQIAAADNNFQTFMDRL
jgi:hypothetical protein